MLEMTDAEFQLVRDCAHAIKTSVLAGGTSFEVAQEVIRIVRAADPEEVVALRKAQAEQLVEQALKCQV